VPSVRESIEIIAIAPKPLSANYLQEYFNKSISSEQIINSGLVIFDSDRDLLSLKQSLAKQVIQEKLGKRKTELKQKLLEIVRKSSKRDDELLTLLLEDLNDYSGLVELLDTSTIKKSFDTGDINTVMERMRKTSKLALDKNKLEDISKWSWGLSATKEFLSNVSTTHEINALIAIGESQKALKMAYNFPETISKIRLLARVYTSMKDRHEHVPISALEELQVMIDELGVDKLENEVVQDLIVSLLSVEAD
jgi:hypothetical protein